VFAERLVRETGLPRTYVATAQAFDAEMTDRIARHRLDRGEGWVTVEAPLDLGGALAAANRPGSVVLVDCLTLWLSNVMLAGGDVDAESAALCAQVAAAPGPVAMVSNEVGMGLVPDTPLGRAFRDAQGRLNQRMAAVCDLVVFCAAGLPLWLKTP
jgi:adenosylcobinamide kinase/adenosylcobinamide-phosphate guanylyltransferase